MNKKLLSACLFVLLTPSLARSQDLSGAPLPEPIITQETHDEVVKLPPFKWPGVYWHWIASGWTIAVQGAEIIKIQGELAACELRSPPPPPYPTNCFECFDGPGGCLWKEVSEAGPGAVLLLPDDPYCGQSAHIDGANVVRTACHANGGRTHWWFDRTFVEPVTVKFSDGSCLFVEVPSVRND